MQDMTEMMREEFHRLDAAIKQVEEELKPFELERERLAELEAEIRDRVQDLKARRQEVIARYDLQEMARERRACVAYVRSKTGKAVMGAPAAE